MPHQDALKAPLPAVPRAPTRMRWGLFAVIGVVVIGGVFVVVRSRHATAEATAKPGGGPGAAAAARPVPVVTSPVVVRDLPIYLDGLGNAVPLSTVTVRSQVDGR